MIPSRKRGAFTLIHDSLNTTNFFAFGIGSSVNRYLIEGIARAGQGEPFVVTRPEEADEAGKAGDERQPRHRRLLSPRHGSRDDKARRCKC